MGGRVAARLSPTDEKTMEYFGNGRDAEVYPVALDGLNRFPLAYVLLTEPRWFIKYDDDHSKDIGFSMPTSNDKFRSVYHGTLIAAGGFTPRTAREKIESGTFDAIAFGRWFISNPDLPKRLETGRALTPYDRNTFYTQ